MLVVIKSSKAKKTKIQTKKKNQEKENKAKKKKKKKEKKKEIQTTQFYIKQTNQPFNQSITTDIMNDGRCRPRCKFQLPCPCGPT